MSQKTPRSSKTRPAVEASGNTNANHKRGLTYLEPYRYKDPKTGQNPVANTMIDRRWTRGIQKGGEPMGYTLPIARAPRRNLRPRMANSANRRPGIGAWPRRAAGSEAGRGLVGRLDTSDKIGQTARECLYLPMYTGGSICNFSIALYGFSSVELCIMLCYQITPASQYLSLC